MNQMRTILVVEDQAINRILLRKILSVQYHIIEAENGAIAWNILTDPSKEIDAVLTDIVMPVMDGYGLLEKIRHAAMTELPIIVMTGESDQAAETKALDAGAWDFVPKPFNAQVLLCRLRNALARRQVSLYEQMQKMAAHDSLTGLYNRTHMFDKTRQMIDSLPDQNFVFLRADIDHFALYNSAFGEEEGDKLLRYVASIIQSMLAEYEHCCYGRISSDIFCACVEYSGNDQLLQQRIKEAQTRLTQFKKNYLLEFSVGVYCIDTHEISIEECFLRASLAAQKCKRQYGHYIGYYDKNAVSRAAEEIEIANEMEAALHAEQFVVYLQPKVDLSTDQIVGAEALIRWQHPKKGLVSPGVFIPVFERNGFIAQLDYYVWDKTCLLLRNEIDAGKKPFPVSVNISRISLYNPQLVLILVSLIEKYHLEYRLLQLEITESAYMTNPDLMRDTIHKLREAGFTILMDDFGSGYSSLNTLKEIEVDVLKIDMKFLPVDQNVEKGEIILVSIIKMANWLGMSVVVEGVETREQRDFLEGAGCNCVQGYFYARPMPSEDYEQKYLVDSPAKQQINSVAKETPVPAHNFIILIIDDSEIDRAILTEYLQDYFYVHSCNSVENALIYLKHNQNRVRLILIDNILPGMTGLDFLTYCRDTPSLRSIPQIMISSSDNVDSQVKAFRCGAYDYITKPLVKEIVMARVDHVVNISRQYHSYETDLNMMDQPSSNE